MNADLRHVRGRTAFRVILSACALRLSSSRATPWDEDNNYFSGGKGSSIVIMEWKETPSRSVRNLPIKLSFGVRDPERARSSIISNGGSAANVTGGRPGAPYAKDPDGYLLELLPGSGDTYLAAVSIGVSNINRATDWWTRTTGMIAGPPRQSVDGNC